MNKSMLFWASNIALITTAMSFAIRTNIMTDFETSFVVPYVSSVTAGGDLGGQATDHAELIKSSLGLIGTVAFFSFGLSILFGGPLVDLLGMGNLLRLAAVCHIGGALMTIFAPSYWVVVVATFIVGAGNGLVEAVCNPLIATLYPDEKAHKLTLFHAWFPGGMVIGGVAAWALSKVGDEGASWKVKMALLLIPAVIYTFMILGQKFPPTERVASGYSFGDMFREAFRRPLFWIVGFVMWLTAATELGPGSWIPNVYDNVVGGSEGVLAIVWGSMLMYILRQFFSKPVHKISPIALIAITAPLAAVGLFLFNFATSPPMFFLAATLLYVGVCYWWPTMLGITSERCPKTGALGLAIMGGIGSFSTFLAGPVLGYLNGRFSPTESLAIWSVLPVGIFIIFGMVYLHDRSRGGYQRERLEASQATE